MFIGNRVTARDLMPVAVGPVGHLPLPVEVSTPLAANDAHDLAKVLTLQV